MIETCEWNWVTGSNLQAMLVLRQVKTTLQKVWKCPHRAQTASRHTILKEMRSKPQKDKRLPYKVMAFYPDADWVPQKYNKYICKLNGKQADHLCTRMAFHSEYMNLLSKLACALGRVGTHPH